MPPCVTIRRAVLLALFQATTALGQNFVHFESPHVHPIEFMPGGHRVVAVNTAAGRLEVFEVLPAHPFLHRIGSVAVGVEPVSVRARDANEVWVVNHVSDSVSVVDLDAMQVRATILTGDEPADVVFAGSPVRAFISASQANRIEVVSPTNLLAPPVLLQVDGEDPRALATDGTRVFAAIFECGNDTTVIPSTGVSSAASPYAGSPNPPPNAGSSFSPPLATGLPQPPATSLIVRRDAGGRWRDDNNRNWSGVVTWDLVGNDLAVIDASTLAVSHAGGFMTVPMAIAATDDGRLLAVGTDLMNHVRFEPNLNGTFVRVRGSLLLPGDTTAKPAFDLNPHLTYTQPNEPMPVREQSIGDPRGLAIEPGGSRAFVTGMGSDNVVAIDPQTGARTGMGQTGEGPTGIALDDGTQRLFVLNKFEGSVSVIDAGTLSELARVPFFDPTPQVVRLGRPFLFNTHISSGLGQASCGSCHIDGRADQLAWDLGNPAGSMLAPSQICNNVIPGLPNDCEAPHPMKGPMVTQTLLGLSGELALHWRGDRDNLGQFGGTASALMGADADFTQVEMDRLGDYLATISFPPNPNRNLDGSLKTSLGTGNPVNGQSLFLNGQLHFVDCVGCHATPAGSGTSVISPLLMLPSQSVKTPQLRNLYEKTGFSSMSAAGNRRGFGYLHDGSIPTLFDFMSLPIFGLPPGAPGDADRKDVAAFLLSWDTGTHASIGAQATVGGPAPNGVPRRDQLRSIASAGSAQLVAKAVVNGTEHGWLFQPSTGLMLGDTTGVNQTLGGLDTLAGLGVPVTYTLLPNGTGQRAIDRDGDGFLDGDELLAGSDPSNPNSFPGSCPADLDASGSVDAGDVSLVLLDFGPCQACPSDLDGSGTVDAGDLSLVLLEFGPCP